MKNLIKRFAENSGRLLLFTPFLFLLFNVLTLSALQAYPVDKGSPASGQSYRDLPPGSAPAIAKAMLKDLPVEYQLREEGRTFTMSNPAHDMEIYFTPDGIQVASGDRRWGMAMTGIGTHSSVKPVQKAVVQNDNGRMVYERGDVVEWYVNSPWGMEQGFTIQKAPGERNRDGLVVELSISGDLQPVLDSDTLVLTDAKGNSIARYTGLNVFDAGSKSLPARLTLADRTLRIHVDDVHAKYPVTIDPWIQQAKLTAGDGAAGDYFGKSVAISGDTIVVGAFYDDDNGSNSGSAYVFAKPASGWTDMTQIAKLTASDGAAEDWFGSSVAISGDTIVIGAQGDDLGGDLDVGSVYVFAKPVSGWVNMTQTAKLTASDGFGYSVAISGDTIVVGAMGVMSAYVFTRPDSSSPFTQIAKLTSSDGTVGDGFGSPVAISGDTIVVGAYCNYPSGSAYVFAKPASGWTNMTQTAKLTASDGAADAADSFGRSVAISGETIVVGANTDDSYAGSAYVFAKPASGWTNMTQTAKLTASDRANGDEFGYSVSIYGDTIGVGSPSADVYTGSAYVFAKPASGWTNMTQTAKLTEDDGATLNSFGMPVVVSGDMILVGTGDSGTGAVYVFKSDTVIPVIPVKTEQWGLILDNGLGNANLTLSKMQDGTVIADGNWAYTYQGMKSYGPISKALVTISGKSIFITATGTATSPTAPPGYTTSPYTGVYSGTAFNGKGSGTFSVTFQTYGWPKMISGYWQGTRTSGSGITAESSKSLPWLMLLLND